MTMLLEEKRRIDIPSDRCWCHLLWMSTAMRGVRRIFF
uniref:Uncharacterized protein n=1 Tax=Ascaris lumbricoides TaxID=6252 RepID=A0A0M3IN43_ASCLU